MSVAELKANGNAAFPAKDYQGAIQAYNDAIAAATSPEECRARPLLEPLRMLRRLRDWTKALDDAESCIKANPSFAKGTAARALPSTAPVSSKRP